METNYRSTNVNNIESATVVSDNAVLKGSFAWMTLAMVLTGIAAVFLEANAGILVYIFSNTFLRIAVLFAPLIFVMAMGIRFQKFSYTGLIAMFLAYSLLNGITFGAILMIFKIQSVLAIFLSTAALFAIMAIAGYTTKTDLTKLGSILMIGLIGIVIATLINFFAESETMDYIISILGVVIFTGLTAYDVQKIKNMGQQVGFDGTLTRKLSVMGALTLYLDFINLFLFLLRLFGDRK